MAKYEIEITRFAEECLKKLSTEDRSRVVSAILSLAENPLPRGARKLQGYEDVFRIRVGSFRVLYSVENTRLIILILKIGHRRNIYTR
jgi:mRNA interferase RelE/StbE